MIVNEIRRQFPLQWDMTRGYRLPTRVLGEPYFIRWTGEPKPLGEGWNTASFDDDGLLRTGSFRNPVSISQFALSQYEDALEGNILARNTFTRHAQWLAQAQDSNGGYAYPIALAQYDAAPGWL